MEKNRVVNTVGHYFSSNNHPPLDIFKTHTAKKSLGYSQMNFITSQEDSARQLHY